MSGRESTTDSTTVDIPLDSIVLGKERQANQQRKKEIDRDQVSAILHQTTEQLNNAKGIMELHPDLQMAMEIRTSMILSPKDMMFPGLKLKIDRDVFENNEEISSLLTDLTNLLKTETDLEIEMPKFIDEALFMYGANIWLMMPPNSLDKAIAGDEIGFESMDNFTGYFGNASYCHKENETLKKGGVIEITDNMNWLRRPTLIRQMEETKQQVSMESDSYAPRLRMKKKPLARMFAKTKDITSKGNPYIFKVPKDAILPVHEPSDPSNHICYLVMLDKNGYIVSNVEDSNYFEKLGARLKAAAESKSGADYKVLKEMGFDGKEELDPSRIIDMYKHELEGQIQSAVENTSDGSMFKMKEHESFYRMMFARKMEQQETRLLYVPAYMVDYMAFDYDTMGHGISLLEKTQLYSSLRAVVMFSDLIRQLNNSIPQTDLNVTLDADDRDPHGTIQTMLQEYGRLTDRSIPLGTFSPSSMMDELRRSGIRVNVEGGDKFPGTKLNVEDRQRSIARVESDLADMLKRAQYAGLSVPPELIDQNLQGDFAINTVTSNQFFQKRSMVDQYTFRKLMKERILKWVYLSNSAWSLLSDKLEDDEKIEQFLDAIELSLPSADGVRIEQQMEACQKYFDFIDMVMEIHFSDVTLRGLVNAPIAGDGLEELRGTIGAHFKRQYIVDENILPEIQDLHTTEEGEGIADALKDYHESIFNTVGAVIKSLMKEDNDLTKTVEKLQSKYEGGDEGGEPSEEDTGGYTAPSWDFGGDSDSEDTAAVEEDVPEPDVEEDTTEPVEEDTATDEDTPVVEEPTEEA